MIIVVAGAKNISSGGGSAAGKAASKLMSGGSALGSAAGRMVASASKKLGSAAGRAAKTPAKPSRPKTGTPKPDMRTGRPSPRPPHGRRVGGGSIGGTEKKSKVDLTGKTKAQIMALKRLGKI